jgi:hypothetical protein
MERLFDPGVPQGFFKYTLGGTDGKIATGNLTGKEPVFNRIQATVFAQELCRPSGKQGIAVLSSLRRMDKYRFSEKINGILPKDHHFTDPQAGRIGVDAQPKTNRHYRPALPKRRPYPFVFFPSNNGGSQR